MSNVLLQIQLHSLLLVVLVLPCSISQPGLSAHEPLLNLLQVLVRVAFQLTRASCSTLFDYIHQKAMSHLQCVYCPDRELAFLRTIISSDK